MAGKALQSPAAPAPVLPDWEKIFPGISGSGEFRSFCKIWAAGKGGECGGCGPSAAAFLLGLAHRRAPRPWVAVLPTERRAREFRDRIETFLPSAAVFFPAFEVLADDEYPPAPEISGQRLGVLARLSAGESFPVIAELSALLQPVPPREELVSSRLEAVSGKPMTPEGLARWLAEAGYQPSAPVAGRGEFARRGGIVDVFPGDSPLPVRLEFDGDEIASVRTFDPSSQRSLEKISGTVFYPLGEKSRGRGSFLDYLPPGTVLIWPEEIPPAASAGIVGRPGTPPSLSFSPFRHEEAPGTSAADFTFLGLERFAYRSGEGGGKFPLLTAVAKWVGEDVRVGLVVKNPGEDARLREILAEYGLVPGDNPRLVPGELDSGFFWEEAQAVLVPDCQIFSRYRYLGTRRPGGGAERVRRPSDLKPGDYVVHLEHGIGRYLGMAEAAEDGIRRPKLLLQYADEARLYLPPAQARLLSRYMGIGGAAPRLDRLGGGRWKRARAAAEKAVARLAGELLEVQATRTVLPGHAFSPDGSWQTEFEAAFPFEETPDQVRALSEIKQDMRSSKPMDRLICGDVGYGKTEVAVRAAFKAALDGKQTAVLVPTTVLAQQHFRTFRERMADYPVRVEVVSRLQKPAAVRRVVAGMRAGAVDIVIGTHRLLQKDVAFRDLGLVVIDEEQRFGVRHKEKFKRLRALVDVLTMTATPIPRTLYLALTGARDLSSIATAPRDRLAVRTVVAPYARETVERALRRELEREGQAYYLHNRVETIGRAAEKIRLLFPRARVGVAHGRMPEGELGEVMELFARGGIDILVCTTIIESGLDIPNANTLVVDRADRFGLADLYQLRGRVGRTDRRAYAYFLYPLRGCLSSTAKARLRALEEFSQLGSGFDLSLRDLEIRGAGNILGREQHGHILAVGFELYCRLLEESVGRLKGETTPRPPEVKLEFETPGCLPDAYIASEKERLEIYRKWSAIPDFEGLEDWLLELRDRFGPVPEEVKALAIETSLRLAAAKSAVDAIGIYEGKFVLRRGEEVFEVISPPRRLPGGEAAALSWLARRLQRAPHM